MLALWWSFDKYEEPQLIGICQDTEKEEFLSFILKEFPLKEREKYYFSPLRVWGHTPNEQWERLTLSPDSEHN